MLYKITFTTGLISGLVNKEIKVWQSKKPLYCIIVDGERVSYNSKSEWLGIGTAKQILKTALRYSLYNKWHKLQQETRSYLYRELDDWVDDLIKQHGGEDPSCKIYFKKLEEGRK